jgi:hypothetical protein
MEVIPIGDKFIIKSGDTLTPLLDAYDIVADNPDVIFTYANIKMCDWVVTVEYDYGITFKWDCSDHDFSKTNRKIRQQLERFYGYRSHPFYIVTKDQYPKYGIWSASDYIIIKNCVSQYDSNWRKLHNEYSEFEITNAKGMIYLMKTYDFNLVYDSVRLKSINHELFLYKEHVKTKWNDIKLPVDPYFDQFCMDLQ